MLVLTGCVLFCRYLYNNDFTALPESIGTCVSCIILKWNPISQETHQYILFCCGEFTEGCLAAILKKILTTEKGKPKKASLCCNLTFSVTSSGNCLILLHFICLQVGYHKAPFQLLPLYAYWENSNTFLLFVTAISPQQKFKPSPSNKFRLASILPRIFC